MPLNTSPFVRTDIAMECRPACLSEGEGFDISERNENGISVCRVEIKTAAAAKAVGKPHGSYITINSGRIWQRDADFATLASKTISDELNVLIEKLCASPKNVLIAGLGNRRLTADALGPLAADGICVTRHIRHADPALARRLGYIRDISAIAPGVSGQSGIESVDIIRAAADKIKPDLVIAIDALAAKSTERLASAVQLSDSGIQPGAGVGNAKLPLDRATLNCPVIAIGAPTIVSSATLICDALEQAEIDDIPKSLIKVLENGRDFFVSPKECDAAVSLLAQIIADAINLSLSKE